ncbi:MAG: hypothetical protein ABIH03_07175, partial [Pseudomonadota bacterium]
MAFFPIMRWAIDPRVSGYALSLAMDIAIDRARAQHPPDMPLGFVLSTRDVARYRDVSVMILDHFSKIYMTGELKTIDTAIWSKVLAKGQYAVGVGSRGQSMDDPDVAFYESFMCKSPNNTDGYCNKETEAMIERQSAMTDQAARKRLVKEIDKKLQMEAARPTITFAA